jgi:hypothetical protein
MVSTDSYVDDLVESKRGKGEAGGGGREEWEEGERNFTFLEESSCCMASKISLCKANITCSW